MTRRPSIWRSPSCRARIERDRRQRDALAMYRLAQAHDAREAERAAQVADAPKRSDL